MTSSMFVNIKQLYLQMNLFKKCVVDVNFLKDSWKMAPSKLNTHVYISTQHRTYPYMRCSTDTECSEWDG